MTAPTVIYTTAPKVAWEALLATGTPRFMLVDAAYTPDQDGDTFIDDVDGDEAAGTGYTAGGPALASVTVTLDTATNTITITATDISGISVPCRWGVFYVDTGTPATSPVLSFTDFSEGLGGNVTLTGTDSMSTSGLLEAVVAA